MNMYKNNGKLNVNRNNRDNRNADNGPREKSQKHPLSMRVFCYVASDRYQPFAMIDIFSRSWIVFM
jgi:hypothetical protein